MNSKIWLLRQLRPLLTQNASITVLKSLVLPQIDTGLVFLSGLNQANYASIQVLQNIAIRVCLKIYVPRDAHVDVIHAKVKVSKIDVRLKYLQSNICHRLVARNGIELILGRNTRAADGPLIKQINPRLIRHSKNPSYKAIDTWNSLPPNIRNLSKKNAFKTQVKGFLKTAFPLLLPIV